MQRCVKTRMEPKQDSFNETVSSLFERKVRSWLSGVIDDMRRSSPVQQWLDSLPADAGTVSDPAAQSDQQVPEAKSEESNSEYTITQNTVVETADKTIVESTKHSSHDDKNLEVPMPKEMWKRKSLDSSLLSSTPQHRSTVKKLNRDHSVQSEGYVPKFKNPLLRDHSLQSDASGSSGSSVLNVLGARKVDAESVLLALGFGPSEKQQKLQRIPDRFLQPSKLTGISTEQFIKDEQHSMRMHDCGVFGYRGLTGNPHVPPSTIVAKIMNCILQDDVCREEALMKARHSIADMRTPAIHARLAEAMRLRHN